MASGLRRPIKPLHPLIDWNIPLTRNLVFDSLFTERGGVTVKDQAGRLSGAVTGTPTWGNDLYGTCMTYAGASDTVTFTMPTGAKVQAMTVYSYEVLVNMTGTGGAATGYIVAKGNGVAAPYFLLGCKTAATLQILVGFATTPGTFTIPITQNAWHHIVVTYTLGLANIPIAYVDGILQTVTTSSTPTGANPTEATNLTVGNNAANTRNWAGQISYVRAWNRLLSQSEALILNANPWAMYKLPVQAGMM